MDAPKVSDLLYMNKLKPVYHDVRGWSLEPYWLPSRVQVSGVKKNGDLSVDVLNIGLHPITIECLQVEVQWGLGSVRPRVHDWTTEEEGVVQFSAASDRLPLGSKRGGEVRRVLAIGSGFGIGVAIQANSIGWGIVASMTIFIIAQMFWYLEEWLRP